MYALNHQVILIVGGRRVMAARSPGSDMEIAWQEATRRGG